MGGKFLAEGGFSRCVPPLSVDDEEDFDDDELDDEFDEESDAESDEVWDEESDAESDEEWDEDFDAMTLVAATARFIVRFRLALAALMVVGMLVTAASVVVPMLFASEGVSGPQSHLWGFQVKTSDDSTSQSIFVEDGATEIITFEFDESTNVSHVYVGAHFSENNENVGVNLCDYVTVIMNLEEVNRTERYETSQTDSRTNDCNVEGDAIWYNYNLTLPTIAQFEGTAAEARDQWEIVNMTGVGLWVIEITVDAQSLLEDSGEDVDITINTMEFEVLMTILDDSAEPQVEV